ncbi:MAG: FecR domain-containing protein [Deltaproteobacteria bacterium]|nr:FecR domain-containing protein [Deltaproteobacteria bacterium]
MKRLDTFARSILAALAAAALLALAGWFLFERFLALPAPLPPAAQPAPDLSQPMEPAQPRQDEPALGARATVVEGHVERSSGEHWVNLTEGELLGASQSVRTAPGARVELEIGGADSRLTIPERSEVGVGEVSRAVHRLKLRRGRIQVAYQPSGERVLRIEGEKGGVAQTRGARFMMVSTGVAVAVATETGVVDLSAQGASVEVAAGQQAVATQGQRPSQAEPIPKEALLKVARAAADAESCAIVRGSARPGAEVTADGVAAQVDAQGRFEVRVPRRPGVSQVVVQAREVSGTSVLKQVACTERAPSVRSEVKVDWNAEP